MSPAGGDPSAANVRGMLYMLVSTALLTCMHGVVRHLGSELHPFEIAFFRNVFGLLAVLPLVYRAGLASLVSRQPMLQGARAAIGVGAMFSWFYALSVVPIAEATALSFTVVIFGSIGAAVFLGERMRLRRWTAVGTGFVGTLIILRPGLEEVDLGALLVIFSTLCWSAAVLVVKHLSRTDHTIAIVTWNAVALSVLSLPPALLVWTAPTGTQLAWLVLVGVLGTGGHLAMTSALKIADASAVFPVDFTRLIWAAALGFVAFGEVPDLWTWIGGAVIFASTSYISYREARVRAERAES